MTRPAILAASRRADATTAVHAVTTVPSTARVAATLASFAFITALVVSAQPASGQSASAPTANAPTANAPTASAPTASAPTANAPPAGRPPLWERGRVLYADQCAGCHGAEGQGHAEHYPHVLAGDKSINELAKLIHDTMPKDAAELCVGEDARAAAVYIHESFYSPAAQARRQPPRVELARLTVRQHEQALADLLGTKRSQAPWTAETG